jgi:hypothetical protein
MEMSTPPNPPANCTLIVAPATGRLTLNRLVRCASSGPYPATTAPISKNTSARTANESGGRLTPSRHILVAINDQSRDSKDIGSYAGWGSGGEVAEPEKEPTGPALMPFLRYRASDRTWRVGFGLLWIPAMFVVLTIEHWLNIPPGIQWISLGVLFVVFVGTAFASDRLMR